MNKIYIPTLFVLVVLAILHLVGSHFYLYTRYPGYDILMHIVGSIGISLAIYWIAITFFEYKISLWSLVSITFAIGLVWEIFESFNDIAGAPVGTLAYYVDSAKDLCDDILGAIFAGLYLKK